MARVDPRSGTMLVFNHDPWRRLTAFRVGEHDRAVVVIGGQSDTFFSLNYIDSLTQSLVGSLGYSVVQPMFSSWFSAFGENTLENDNDDLDCLLGKLLEVGVKEVVLFGFNTGVQDILNYIENGDKAWMVKRLVFQGGMRNPEADLADIDALHAAKDVASRLVKSGFGNALMPPGLYSGPISPYRYLALGGRRLVKDFFNPNQTVDDMTMVLGHIRVPCLVLFCLVDTYNPSAAEKNAQSDKIQEAIPADTKVVHISASCDENLNFMRGSESLLADEVIQFLAAEDRKEKERRRDKMRGEVAEEKRKRSIVFQAKSGSMKRSPSQVSVSSHDDGRPSLHAHDSRLLVSS
ncbi:UPF0613 protein PB24D3.06c [Diplonema papillatum]|nr:UPF0613 protein PB24D3.06c [Diplonema papillatum]KAJ9438065.1 UPF0613 protein PB24D3.06c [Diplonema papillatum]